MIAGVPTGALVVFSLIGVALVLFVTERIPTDVTAIGIIVALAALEPLTGVDHRAAISGFANTATVTIVAMYMLSAGIQATGAVQRLGLSLARFTKGSETRALAATICTTGPIAGFVNNTPIVAVFVPMISDLAEQTGISPSKLLLPLSYAAILGGTVTLLGTSTNLLASEFAVELLGREPIGMFEFSALGVLVLAVGLAYLMTLGRRLTPARVPVDADLVTEFDLEDHLTTVRVGPDSSAVGGTVTDLEASTDADVRVLQLRRESDPDRERSAAERPVAARTDDGGATGADDTGETGDAIGTADAGKTGGAGDADGTAGSVPSDATPTADRVFGYDESDGDQPTSAGDAEVDPDRLEVYPGVDTDQRVRAGDVLTVHGSLQAVNEFVTEDGLRQLVRESVTEDSFETASSEDRLVKAVVPDDSPFVGDSIAETGLRDRYRTTVLAVRRGGEVLRRDLRDVTLAAGDVLVVQTLPGSIDHFVESGDLLVADADAVDRLLDSAADVAPLSSKTPVAFAIMGGVVGLAALGVTSVVIAALAGVFCMIVTGCLSPADAYDAVSWNVVFLLAGVIPLGVALDATGGSELIAAALVSTAAVLPVAAVLLLFYLVTGLLANVITPVATVVLMIPVAVESAGSLGADPFSFLLAVTFASATSFMTPVGYQTNLMVYGPGGYEFTDFVRVGGPLQFLLAGVTTAGIVLLWGV